jgi:RHS repeat-associated protein
MRDQKAVPGDQGERSEQAFAVTAPQISLPKGGGAIRGIGEKFAANPVTGTGSLTVPIFTSPGRSGFGPQFSLSYDSGSGNGPFGFGWSLALPSITRKTDKGLPQYEDGEEFDTFILSGAEDLVPLLVENNGQWTRDVLPPRTVYGKQYGIHRYRPRVEGLFARIERWANLADSRDTFWRSISKDNITTWYGKTAESRIADPADPSRIFTWLICESYDDKGNVIAYRYKPENSDGVDLSQAHERNRSDTSRSANRYLKHVFYGNRTPYFPDLTAGQPVPLPTDWCFELVFDYGEHDDKAPVPQETGTPWDCRADPFSSYRATFEVRTYRLCRRALMFHHFAGEPGVGLNCLVRSTDLAHARVAPPADPAKPFYSYLLSVTQTGYKRDGQGGYLSKSLPPLEFAYTEAVIDETVREIDPESLENLPYGLDGSHYQWIDLDGEGLSGILTEQGGSWFYKPNLSPATVDIENGAQTTRARFGPVQRVARQPSLAALASGRQQFLDLTGDGQRDLVELEGPTPGFFERTEDEDWAPFTPFRSLPVVDWKNPNLKFVDVTGDGLADLLISEDDAFLWHPSRGGDGFGAGQRVAQALDEEKGPKLIFADGTESIFLADMSGDGLTDIVRIRNGEICYWPNLGYGRFGAKVKMDQAPWFEAPDLFDGRRVRLADIDGTGTADIIYFASRGVQLYFNQSGNGWGARRLLSNYPPVDSVSSATALDLLGNGTACLAWSSALPGNMRRPMRYIDLMGGQKPHLLVQVANNLGAETRVRYAPSTRFYVADKLAGTPWLTRIPFPVHVVERVETYDWISRNRFVTRYAYHHGYYDGVEREFRGFGKVEQWDTEEFATLTVSGAFPQATNIDAASNVPPVLTKTWFHTGAYFGEAGVLKHFEEEYYREGDEKEGITGLTDAQLEAMLLDDAILPATILLPDGSRVPYNLSGEEAREACRALRGSILRQEIYAQDGTDAADRPYSASERNYTIEVLQPQGPNRYAVFITHPRETIDFHYERKLYKVVGNTLVDPNAPRPNAKDAADPRVTHTLTLAVDTFGNVLQSAAVGYGRRYLDPNLEAPDQAKEGTTLCSYVQNRYTNAVLEDDAYRKPLPAESEAYELLQVRPKSAQAGITNLFRFGEMQSNVQNAGDGKHDILYENVNPTGLKAGEPYRRLIERTRTLYRPDDLGAAAGDARALLPLLKLEPLALPGNSYKLAFTPGLLSSVYRRNGTALLPVPDAVLGNAPADGGGYVDLDADGHWWVPAGRTYYLPRVASPQVEKNEALKHFYLRRRVEDVFGNSTTADYDQPHDLFLVKTVDALANTVSAAIDYRVLQPSTITDANGNRSAVSFDILGRVAGTAVMGKLGENVGDTLAGFSADITEQQIDDFHDADDPRGLAGALLGGATSRVVYDLQRFFSSRMAAPNDPSKWQPVYAVTIARETHLSDLLPNQTSRLQIALSYSDGLEREIQKKSQAEPGPVIASGPVVNPRWVGSGWTIFNNKGKPVRKYEPFFSRLPAKGHQFEFGAKFGVSPIICYDPAGRVVATIHPNHAYDKVPFDPWHAQTWDVNDTVLQTDPKADADVGGFFSRLPDADYLPTWYTQRSGGGLGPHEKDAADKTVAHANTPGAVFFDALGRKFLTVVDNAAVGKYTTRVEFDIEGNQRSVTDTLGRKVTVYDFDMLSNTIHQASMEAGERWKLNDASGKPIRSWDSRGHNLRSTYDALRRPTGLFVQGTDPASSDPRTLGGEVQYGKTVYGEGQPNDQALNLRTRGFQQYDTAGMVTNLDRNPVTNQDEAYDFKGNLLRSKRQLVADYKGLPNWSLASGLQPRVFSVGSRFDALNRPIATTTPDGSVTRPTFNEANLLERIDVQVRGSRAATPFVTNIDYNARGQRVLAQFGNQVDTTYTYDEATFRLARLTTMRQAFSPGEAVVQDLSYTYDPSGNIVHLQDDADIQNVVFFRNRRVEPSSDYTYDATYRLIQASGREHLGQSGARPTATSYNDFPRCGLLQPGDGNAMGTYVEQYQYDAVGNFLQFIHRGSSPASPGWTRTYSYNGPVSHEPGKFTNRVTSSAVNTAQPLNEGYTYDLHGNITSMPQLQWLAWDFRDQLTSTQRQAVNALDQDGVQHQGERTYYQYDVTGQRLRKVTERQNGTLKNERVYFGGFEVYREHDGAGVNVTLERETLHVMDSKRRVALVETKTVDISAPPSSLPDSVTRYQFDNHLGSACLELDEAAALISYEEYYPFGGTSYQAGRTAAEVALKRYRYAGRERDEETGLSYHGARYYALWLGRWTACDPAGIRDSNNLYQFCLNNPVKLTDTSGLQAVPTVGRINDVEAPELGMEIKARPPGQPAGTTDASAPEGSSSDTGGKPDAASPTTEGAQEADANQEAKKEDGAVGGAGAAGEGSDRAAEQSSDAEPEDNPTAPKGSAGAALPRMPAADVVKNGEKTRSSEDTLPADTSGAKLQRSGAQTTSKSAASQGDAKQKDGSDSVFIVTGKDKPFLKRVTKLKTSEWGWTKYVFFPFVALGYLLIKATSDPQRLSHFGRALRTFATTMFWGFFIFGAIRDLVLPELVKHFPKVTWFSTLAKALGAGSTDKGPVDFPWSAVHFLAGWIFFFMGAPFPVVAALTVLWEGFEMFAHGFGENEVNSNRLADIGLAWAGWLISFALHAA